MAKSQTWKKYIIGIISKYLLYYSDMIWYIVVPRKMSPKYKIKEVGLKMA